jgi:hypothetical protein
MKYLFVGTCTLFLLGTMALVLYTHPTKSYRPVTFLAQNSTLSNLAHERIAAIAKTYPHNTELFKSILQHFPALLNIHISRSGSGLQQIEYDIEKPIACIKPKNGSTSAILFANGTTLPEELIAEDITARLPIIIIHTESIFENLSEQEKEAYAHLIASISSQVLLNHTITLLNKTLLVLQDAEQECQLWCSPATPLSFIERSITYADNKKSSTTTHAPYIIETRIPQTIIIKNKSKGWIPL